MDLGTSAAARRPTDERIRDFEQGNDPHLAALYFQFGRYLLISCSRPDDQPANLQGLWNESMTPPWESKYTININTEMNYWPAEVGNLAECAEPLFHMIRQLTDQGADVAREHYGARGWVLHQNTDLWRVAAPMDEETREVASAFTVLRDGWTVGRGPLEGTGNDQLIALMVGRTVDELFHRHAGTPSDETALEVESLSAPGLHEASFRLRRGEVLGVFGLMGSGRTEMLRAPFGLARPKAAG